MTSTIRNGWLLVTPNFRIRLADISAYERAGANVHIHLHGVGPARAVSPARKDAESPEDAVIAFLDLLDGAFGLLETQQKPSKAAPKPIEPPQS